MRSPEFSVLSGLCCCCPSTDSSDPCPFSSRLVFTASSQTRPPTAMNLTVRRGLLVLPNQTGPCVGSVGHPELLRAFGQWPCCLGCGWGLSALATGLD